MAVSLLLIVLVCAGLTFPPGVLSTSCSDGWVNFRGSKYCMVNGNADASTAVAGCANLDGVAELAKISTNAEFEFIADMGKTLSFWIGLNDKDVNTNYLWEDGSVTWKLFWNTADGFPTNELDNNCVKVNAAGRWEDIMCTTTLNYYLCEAIGACNEGEEEYNGNCYRVFSNPQISWFSANEYCQDRGYVLMDITDSDENTFSNSLGSNGYQWIGAYFVDGNWKWQGSITSSPVTYENWGPSSINGDEYCGQLHSTDNPTWGTAMCINNYGFVCERGK
ncbi:low affinity immunoglobulin epsilon Fc receptor-like [Saccoglossus kowalevskii]